MGRKGKDSKKEKSKTKHSKETKRKKRKKSKQRRSSNSPSDSSRSSGSDDERLDVNKQLQMGRAAARAVREILAYNQALRKELRELVRQLDSGGALDISGIPHDFLRSRLLALLDNLVQLRKNSAGQYFKRQGATTVLSFVAPLLDESEEQLALYRKASQQHAAAVAGAAAEAAQAEEQQAAMAQHKQLQQGGRHKPSAASAQPDIGPVVLPPVQQLQQHEGLVSSCEDERDEAVGALASSPIGPLAPLPAVLPTEGAARDGKIEQEEEEGDIQDDTALGRTAGPAMPPAEWLAAAAQMKYPASDEEGGSNAYGDEERDDFLVGPPPPEVAEELDLASMDERSAEVARVLRVLHLHTAQHEKSTAGGAAEHPPDAYEVLGLQPDTPKGDVKKRYWRLSLLTHPDKCDHPRAHDAFQAVTAAAKELQDAALRKKVDDRRRDAELRREFAAAAAVAERERQWRIARGQATAEDLSGPAAGPGPPSREAWMTELPPERRQDVAAAMPTTGFTGFSQKGVKSRGDTSGWTMTPQQRAAQLEGGGSATSGPLLLTTAAGAGGADRGVAAANPTQAARMARAVDAFNSNTRKKSLMELHAERLAGGSDAKKQKRKKHKTEGADSSKAGDKVAAELGYDPTQHPWRPFNRETDLGPGLNAKANAADLLKGTRALGSKFGGGQGGGRTFL